MPSRLLAINGLTRDQLLDEFLKTPMCLGEELECMTPTWHMSPLQTSADLIWQILQNPATGNLFLLLASLVGVGGSYWLYRKKQADLRDNTRQALLSEIEQSTYFDSWDGDVSEIPMQKVVFNSAYKGHMDNIGLLTNKEVNSVVNYYSQAEILQEQVLFHRDSVREVGMKSGVQDLGRNHRIRIISSSIDKTVIFRWKAIQFLKKNLGRKYRNPELMSTQLNSGMEVIDKHPLLRDNLNAMIERGMLEQVDGKSDVYRITERFEGEIQENS